MRPTVLVVGARLGSLGAALCVALEAGGYRPLTAGLHEEDLRLDVVTDGMPRLHEVLMATEPDHIICTVGMNMKDPGGDPFDWYRWHFETNVIGPMRLYEAWRYWLANSDGLGLSSPYGHYVAISSNSAHVPRSGSAAYCASKAALSQALRCKGREAEQTIGVVVYGYEPGLLGGTPMTARTAQEWPGQPLTRMRRPELATGVSTAAFADLVVAGLRTGPALNGCLLPFDSGER